ncbi:MAG: hypothetical protein NTV01_14760, partial [Bacteroidia bacterium]|nr:hypothetical protein [Bacteroidia bacterium]
LEEKYAAFRLTRLSPSNKLIYPYKKDLLRKTRVLTPWIITVISAAAVVLLALFLWPDSKETLSPSLAKTETVIPETRNPKPETKQPASDTPQLASNTRNPKPKTRHTKTVIPVNLKPDTVEIPKRETVPMNYLSHKSALAGPRIPDPQTTRVLLASSFPSALIEPATSEDALTLPQYALQLFREKILGEDPKLVRRTRFSVWEVAGAGVNKINDIANTDMKLNREYDAKGDLLAVSFNSRLLDVESPIRAQEK